jgi:hypothetical protein
MRQFSSLDLWVSLSALLTTAPGIIFGESHLNGKSSHLFLGLTFCGLGSENLVRIRPYDIPPCADWRRNNFQHTWLRDKSTSGFRHRTCACNPEWSLAG